MDFCSCVNLGPLHIVASCSSAKTETSTAAVSKTETAATTTPTKTGTTRAGGAGTDEDSDPQVRQRVMLQRLLTSMLTHLCRHTSAVECLMKFNDLALLFGAISSPCPPYNKIWRKVAADTLLAIFR